jgi:hypothetical protein
VLLALRQEMCQLTQPWCRWCSSVSVSWTWPSCVGHPYNRDYVLWKWKH